MKIFDPTTRLRAWRLKRNRRGYTLIEAVLVLALASIMTLGVGLLSYTLHEQMMVSHQLRSMDEFALSYLGTWAKVVRNATIPRGAPGDPAVKIRRITAPSEIVVNYIHPKDPNAEELEYTFKYNQRTRLPEIRINGRLISQFRPGWGVQPSKQFAYTEDFPNVKSNRAIGNRSTAEEEFGVAYPGISGRDQVYIIPSGPKGFKVSRCSRAGIPEDFKDKYLTLEFTMVYYRASVLTRAAPFYRELHYTASAYTVNTGWPVQDNGI